MADEELAISRLPAVGHPIRHEQQDPNPKPVDEFEPRSSCRLPVVHTRGVPFPIPLPGRLTEDKLDKAFLDFSTSGPKSCPVRILRRRFVEYLEEEGVPHNKRNRSSRGLFGDTCVTSAC